jgi:shikimate dehydrogenase
MAALLGLIGFPVAHSYSADYFKQKYNCNYTLFPLESVDLFPELLQNHPNLKGLNVTIPHKQQIIPYLNDLDETAKAINAVNTIVIDWQDNGPHLTGYNTDVIGFKKALLEFLPHGLMPKALVLGNGGSAKAVTYALEQIGIKYSLVSRTPKKNELSYKEVQASHINEHQLIINTTPLGMSPNTAVAPDLPYSLLTAKHFLFDLVYNPEETLFMKKGILAGARVTNGLSMLYAQADAAWSCWKMGDL